MGVSKESISKFLIGNRFHVKLRILSPYSNRQGTNIVFEFISFILRCTPDGFLTLCKHRHKLDFCTSSRLSHLHEAH